MRLQWDTYAYTASFRRRGLATFSEIVLQFSLWCFSAVQAHIFETAHMTDGSSLSRLGSDIFYIMRCICVSCFLLTARSVFQCTKSALLMLQPSAQVWGLSREIREALCGLQRTRRQNHDHWWWKISSNRQRSASKCIFCVEKKHTQYLQTKDSKSISINGPFFRLESHLQQLLAKHSRLNNIRSSWNLWQWKFD